MKTQAIHCLYQFAYGLIREDNNGEIDEDSKKKSSDIMLLYSDNLFLNLIENLKKSVD